MAKRVLSLLTVFILLIFGTVNYSVTANATPETHPNTYTNTGNQRADIIGVALTQVGYREGPNNDTKYGARLGINYLGWCGAFVSWCAIEANVPDSVFVKTGVSAPSAYNLTLKPAGYVPMSGDLFFAKDNSHVGLVYYLDGEYFWSLEGNTSEGGGGQGVYSRRHRIDNVNFASPNYQGSAGHNYEKHYESAHPHKIYYKCKDCGDTYYSGATSVSNDCTICKQANCSHKYGGWSSTGSQQHERTCSLCGKKENKQHNWNSGTVSVAATCSQEGKKIIACKDCGLTYTTSIPISGKHTFTGWTKVDNNTHSRSCTGCGKKESGYHSVESGWSNDEQKHWNSCKLCSAQFSVGEHEFSDACDSPCKICGYKTPEGHHFAGEWSTDAESHWKACSGCDVKNEQASHSFDSGCDRTCNVCGYERDVDHIFSESYSFNSTSHWFECTVCGEQKDIQEHSVEEGVREGAMVSCLICGHQLTSAEQHIHGYDEVYHDENGHWGVCSCGKEMEKEGHSWSMRTGGCSVCGSEQTHQEAADDFHDLMPWIYIGCGALLLTLLLVVLMIAFRKKE